MGGIVNKLNDKRLVALVVVLVIVIPVFRMVRGR
jgi:hypothetical protein